MKWIEVPLGGSCSANSAQRQDEIIIALKAIGNAGFISNIEILKSCFEVIIYENLHHFNFIFISLA